jgi:acetolactate synthase-1/2/3 large subunit
MYNEQAMHTAGAALLDVLSEAGVSYVFANLGTDHTALIESFAKAQATGRAVPRLVTCPNEMVALSAAQGYTQATGRPQAVLVHVECGTQALAGAVHNAARCRTPVLILAGTSPFTQAGELRGTRAEYIHWLQDTRDQRGIVRGYMKFDAEIRTGRNMRQMIHRALQIASSDPPGPVYLMAAREVLEENVPIVEAEPRRPSVPPAPLPSAAVDILVQELRAAKRPLVVTSYLCRNPRAVDELVRLSDRMGLGVLDSTPTYLNFPADNPMYQGVQVNERERTPVLADADFILILDSDVPWIPVVNSPVVDARIFHIDIDPLKEAMTLWFHPAHQSFRADCATALSQIRERLDLAGFDQSAAEARRAHYAKLHQERHAALSARERPSEQNITPEYLTACVRHAIDDETIVLNEGVTNSKVITEHAARTRPGTFFTSGGSSLGWNGGAALGMKLADPEKTVVSLTGDGSYMFSVPSTVHWMARRYAAPFLQVVYNNGGWRATKLSTLSLHPDGYASQADNMGANFDPPSDYAGIAAAAGGAFAQKVCKAEELPGAISAALHAVRNERRAAVLDVWLAHL